MGKIAAAVVLLANVFLAMALLASDPPEKSTEQAHPREELRAKLNDGNPWTRRRAAIELGRQGDTAAIDVLVAIVEDEYREHRADEIGIDDDDPREDAARALGTIGQPALSKILALAKAPNREVRAYAGKALESFRDPRGFEPLVAVLRDEDSYARAGAAVALGNMQDPRAIEPLIATLRDELPEIRAAAARGLGATGSPDVVDPLLAALEDPEDTVQAEAAIGLVRFPDERVVAPVIRVTEDLYTPSKLRVLGVLIRRNDPRFDDAIFAALDMKDWMAAGTLAGWIGYLEDRRIIPRLIEALKKKRPGYTDGRLANALRQFNDPRAAETFSKFLDDSDWTLRTESAIGLGMLKDPRAVKTLGNILSEKDQPYGVEDQREAALALGGIGRPGVATLVEAGGHKKSDVREMAAQGLATITDPRAVEPLIDALRHEEPLIRGAAATALGKIGDERAREPLKAAQHDEDEQVRAKVQDALTKIGDGNCGD